MKRSIFAFSLVTLYSAAVGIAHSQPSNPRAALLEGARKEGKLVWYTTMALDDSKPVLDAFTKEYPYIKGELVRCSPYLSVESAAFDPRFRDAKGFWTGIYNNNLVLTYNTKMVPENQAPKNYDDLLQPKWKGNILLHPSAFAFYGTLVHVWGRDKTDAYVKQLAGQNPILRPGFGLIAQLVAAGESPLGFAYNFRAEGMKKDGAPIDWVTTFDPIVTTVTAIGMSAKPANPNSAKLFIDFILSKKAQEIIRDLGRTPSRGDVKPMAPKMDQSKLKLQLAPKEVYLHYNQYAKEYRKFFGL